MRSNAGAMKMVWRRRGKKGQRVNEREREKDKEKEREKEGERERTRILRVT